jgi:probable addiction module antidote protein
MTVPIETTKGDVEDYLKTPETRVAHLEAAFGDGDPKLISIALGDVARSKGMTNVAKDAGITRKALYKALSDKGDPKLSTLLGVLKPLGLRVTVVSANEAA